MKILILIAALSTMFASGLKAQQTAKLQVIHNAADKAAQTVDVYVGSLKAFDDFAFRTATKLIPNLKYGENSMYLQVPENVYKLDIAPTGGQTLVSYTADISGLKGKAITIIASGFLNPAANGEGSAFGLYVVTADGGPFQALPVTSTQKIAKVRIVHNAADPAAAQVDVYVNGEKAIDNFAFRTSSPTLSLDAGTAYEIGIAPGTSNSAADTLKSFTVTLPEGNYVVFANGVIQQGFVANPSGENIGFTIYPLTGIRDAALDTNNIDVIVFHGATDAPAVDVYAGGNNVSAGTKVISNLAYGQTSEKLSVPAADFKVSIAPTGGPELAAYDVPGAALKGKSVIVFASGFLNPPANLNGQAFGLFALVGEAVVQLSSAMTSVNDLTENTENSIAPNPTTGMMIANFAVPHNGPVNIRMHSVTGSLIGETKMDNAVKGMNSMSFDMSSAVPGNYLMTIDAGTYRSVIPFAVIR